MNFETEESKQILIRLAQDKENIVRYEAYDSLSIFNEDEEVQLFFEKSTQLLLGQISLFQKKTFQKISDSFVGCEKFKKRTGAN